MASFHMVIEETQRKVQYFIDNPENRPNYMLNKQLEMIKKELSDMDKIRDRTVFYPYYPKGITDSWDYQDILAEQLMMVLDMYCSL